MLPQAIVTTLHQANGALLLALATLAVVWSRRIWADARPENRPISDANSAR